MTYESVVSDMAGYWSFEKLHETCYEMLMRCMIYMVVVTLCYRAINAMCHQWAVSYETSPPALLNPRVLLNLFFVVFLSSLFFVVFLWNYYSEQQLISIISFVKLFLTLEQKSKPHPERIKICAPPGFGF